MQNSGFRTSAQKEAVLVAANKHFVRAEGPAELAKVIVTSARAAIDANTLRLRALRLARDDREKTA